MAVVDVCVVGLGTVGLPLAASFAINGLRVHGVDRDAARAHAVDRGAVHTAEPGLADRVREVVSTGALRASTEPCAADAFVIAVPTPIAPDRKPDLSALDAAIAEIAPRLAEGNLVVLASTVPVGTTGALAARLRESRRDLTSVHVVFAPERILPGAVLAELARSPRVVGGVDGPSTARGVALYAKLAGGPIATTDSRTAELCKLAENAHRDVEVAFADELASVAQRVGVDAREVTRIANLHPRVHILEATTGAGGPCLPKDAWLFASAAPDDVKLVPAARDVARRRVDQVVERVLRSAPADGPIGCLGVAYKADVDDVRGSTALEVIERLRRTHPGHVYACDPLASARSDLVDLDELLARNVPLVALVRHRAFLERRDAIRPRLLLDFCGYVAACTSS
jgi:UDP-N-acetyl-D-mannosaminuronic acid dehydrogenase